MIRLSTTGSRLFDDWDSVWVEPWRGCKLPIWQGFKLEF